MNNFTEILQLFPSEREQKLRDIERYSMFDIFFYRSTLWHHQIRVFLIVQELLSLVEKSLPECDAKKAQILALVHDDAEIITGDVQLGHKQHMTQEQLQAVDDEEAAAIEKLADAFLKEIHGYNYQQLLLHALHKDCLEARLVSYADKLDAYCESLHELLGGNITALRSVLNYTGILKTFGEKFKDLQPLLAHKDSPFTNVEMRTDPLRVNKKNYLHLNKPHTPESVKIETELPTYNLWKELVLKYLDNEGVEILTTQKEFL